MNRASRPDRDSAFRQRVGPISDRTNAGRAGTASDASRPGRRTLRQRAGEVVDRVRAGHEGTQARMRGQDLDTYRRSRDASVPADLRPPRKCPYQDERQSIRTLWRGHSLLWFLLDGWRTAWYRLRRPLRVIFAPLLIILVLMLVVVLVVSYREEALPWFWRD